MTKRIVLRLLKDLSIIGFTNLNIIQYNECSTLFMSVSTTLTSSEGEEAEHFHAQPYVNF